MQANQLLNQKEPFKARPLIEQAEALWPEEQHIHFYEGVCYQDMGDFPRAIGKFQQVYQADPTLVESLVDIGTCYQLMGNYEDAKKYFKQYLKAAPDADDAAEIQGLLKALTKQESKQIQTDPTSEDYLTAVLKNGRLERWQRERLPIKVFISNGTDDQGRPVNGFHPQYNEMLLSSLNTWVKASNYRLAYVLVNDVRLADLVCTWTDQVGFLRDQGTSVEQGNARVVSRPMPNGEQAIMQAHVVILLVSPASGNFISEEDVKKTCLHEIGHALGFAGHSTNNHDVMFYSESPAVWAALTHRDSNTMARLYGDYPPFVWNYPLSQR